MQVVINAIRLLIVALVITLIGALIALIPPKSAPAQSLPPQQDTVLDKARSVIERFQAVSTKVDYAAAMVDSNAAKAQQIVSILDRLKVKSTSVAKVAPRVIYKDKPVIVEVPKDTTLYYVDGQYIDRPVLIFEACQYTYGGDSFRTNMWKPPNSDGYWKSIKKLFTKKSKNAK